ncbi:hypothetical protein HANVADRAFT_53565 [Hanseniaspora valbyensis NRRL Y-1626]|uniref:Uncharacterized protein n=1 Tax=Hanseniaspora valbyensis NRRL Y-1626 TaxID=766949 RepID=A0A1B7TAY0_9ASCO|nr:hypothetical protein HANVADRAFT_53565 [Hanseniaspora valbyensis NRRL Y-1626]
MGLLKLSLKRRRYSLDTIKYLFFTMLLYNGTLMKLQKVKKLVTFRKEESYCCNFKLISFEMLSNHHKDKY